METLPRHPGHPKTGGRKPGSPNRRTREVALKALAEGITPLDVMLEDMRAKYEAGHLAEAADRARDCAPYMHARLQSSAVQLRRITSLSELTDAELTALVSQDGAADEDKGQEPLN